MTADNEPTDAALLDSDASDAETDEALEAFYGRGWSADGDGECRS